MSTVEYTTFSRIQAAGRIVDVVLLLDRAGVLAEDTTVSPELHAGADTVAFLTTSLTRDMAITGTDSALELEAGLAAMTALAHAGHLSGNGKAIEFEGRSGSVRGLPVTEKSSSVRIQATLEERSVAVEKQPSAGVLATVRWNDMTAALVESGGAYPAADLVLERLADDEVLVRILPDRALRPLAVQLQVLQALIRTDVLYHTVSLTIDHAAISAIFAESEQKVSLSASPRRLFVAELCT